MTIRRTSCLRWTLFAGVAAGGLAPGAIALAASPTAPADQANTVGEIVVTAERTQEDVLNVGINVIALPKALLTQNRVTTATDLATLIPNFDVKTNIPGGQQIITVRGVGLDDFSSSNNSSVGVYVDDIFLSSFAEMDFTMYDLADVEVLKGPQGTLYGRNSTAGAINLTSAPPRLGAFDAAATLGYGNYDTFQADGYVNIPVSDQLALRLSAQTDQQGQGYWYSRVLRRDLGRQNVFHERGQLLYQPNDRFTVLLKVEGEENHSEIGVGKFFGTIPVPGYGGACPNFGAPQNCVDTHGYTDTTPNPFQGDWNHLAPYKVTSFNTTLHIDDDLGWAKLTSITGFIDFSREFYIDADATPFQDAEFDQNDRVKQVSQEFKLAGTTGGIDWLAGAYYSNDKLHSFTPGTLVDLLGLDAFIHSDQETNSGAVYGQVKWPLTTQLTLVTGLRATYEDRSYFGGTELLIPGVPTPLPGATSAPVNKISDANVSWHAGLNWRPSDATLVYFSAAESTKSGGFFNGITFSSAALAPYKPEQLVDYEGGLKTNLFDHRLQLDGSLFYYDYHDYQAQTFTNVGAVSLIKLSNIEHASIYGLDLGFTLRPFDGFSLRGGLGLLHSRLGSFPFITAGGGNLEPAGNKMPDAPDVSFNAIARYEHPVFTGWLGAVQFGAVYEDANFKEALNTPYLSSPASWVFDGRVSLMTADKKWEGAFWVKNMFNEQHAIQATDDGDGDGYRMFNNPRTFGVTLMHHFD
ncbi:MAG TPA: TonB-dependent receptor [Caulobacteraceae bacterium]|nr:TonB-dependent receptor [Caulobacteraceae bacterium]